MWTGVLLLSLVAAAPYAGQPAPTAAADCTRWQDCRDRVEAALAAESFDTALDLAWRAVQRGPKDDPALMFLLARAQARAGRPQDALVMIRRIAERGGATDAATHPDLERVRNLAAWADLEPMVARANAGAAAPPTPPAPSARGPAPPPTAAGAVPPSPSATATPPVPAPAPTPKAGARRTVSGVSVETVRLEETPLRFSATRFIAAGLAYDAVSHRFVVGDQIGRKVRVVAEGLDHAVDLVRAESAGFLDVRALAIDPRRGDLWVASSDSTGETGTLHRLQLVSGRPLQALELREGSTPVRPIDLAVADSGLVFVLDAGGRLLRARPGAAAVEVAARIDRDAPTTVALGDHDTVAYVAHAKGLARVPLRGGKPTEVSSAAELPLLGIEYLRPHRDGFVALQRSADGSRRVVRLELNRNGRAVRRLTAFDTRVDAGDTPTAFAVSGDELSLVTGGLAPPQASGDAVSSLGPPAELVVRRLRLR